MPSSPPPTSPSPNWRSQLKITSRRRDLICAGPTGAATHKTGFKIPTKTTSYCTKAAFIIKKMLMNRSTADAIFNPQQTCIWTPKMQIKPKPTVRVTRGRARRAKPSKGPSLTQYRRLWQSKIRLRWRTQNLSIIIRGRTAWKRSKKPFRAAQMHSK